MYTSDQHPTTWQVEDKLTSVQVALILAVLFSAERITWELQAKKTSSDVQPKKTSSSTRH